MIGHADSMNDITKTSIPIPPTLNLKHGPSIPFPTNPNRTPPPISQTPVPVLQIPLPTADDNEDSDAEAEVENGQVQLPHLVNEKPGKGSEGRRRKLEF